jgi:hypothetical protein
VDLQLSQEMTDISSYHVEGSGWDASDAFFVEKTTLDWSGGDKKEISLRSTLCEGRVMFVRLLQEFGKAESFPIAYRAASVEAGEIGRILVSTREAAPPGALQSDRGFVDRITEQSGLALHDLGRDPAELPARRSSLRP